VFPSHSIRSELSQVQHTLVKHMSLQPPTKPLRMEYDAYHNVPISDSLQDQATATPLSAAEQHRHNQLHSAEQQSEAQQEAEAAEEEEEEEEAAGEADRKAEEEREQEPVRKHGDDFPEIYTRFENNEVTFSVNATGVSARFYQTCFL
jgi:hypothetical protein